MALLASFLQFLSLLIYSFIYKHRKASEPEGVCPTFQFHINLINHSMPRILAIDYGLKRCGIAVTDPLKIIASGLTTVETPKLMKFVKEYTAKEEVEQVIIGLPLNLDETDTDATPFVRKFIEAFKRHLPAIPIEEVDERFSSKRASESIAQMGLKKKDRQRKELVDEVAATMLLQEYLSNF
jgi:putative Holliday junction resolvase